LKNCDCFRSLNNHHKIDKATFALEAEKHHNRYFFVTFLRKKAVWNVVLKDFIEAGFFVWVEKAKWGEIAFY
jgi:hypothetical protein